MIYRLKKGTKGSCKHNDKSCCDCMYRLVAKSLPMYVTEYEQIGKKGYHFLGVGYWCPEIQREQLIPINTSKRQAKYMLDTQL